MSLSKPLIVLVSGFFLVFAMIPTDIRAQDCLQLSDIGAVSPRTKIIHLNLYRALDQAGVCYEAIPLPPRRATSELLRGGIDGEAARIHSYLSIVEEAAIRVEAPMTTILGMLVTHDQSVQSLEDAKTLMIGAMRGIHWSDKAAESLENVIHIDSVSQLIEMFIRKRIDGFMLVHGSFKDDARLEAYNQIVIARLSTHVYLHKNSEAYAPLISQAIQDYKAAGYTFDTLSVEPVGDANQADLVN